MSPCDQDRIWDVRASARPPIPFSTALGDIGKPLALTHDLEIVVRNDPEQVGDLLQHLRMLAGDANTGTRADPRR